MTFITSILFVALVSMTGWLVETALASIRARRIVSRGLMFGPFLPFYGIGAILILTVSTFSIWENPFLYSAIGTAILCVMMYGMEWLLKQFYHISLYKNRATDSRSILFWLSRAAYLYVLCVLSAYIYQPLVEDFSANYATGSQMISSLLVLLFLSEILLFLHRVSKVSRGLGVMRAIEQDPMMPDVKEKSSLALSDLYGLKAILRAYPYLRLYDYEDFYELIDEAPAPDLKSNIKHLQNGLHTLFLTDKELEEKQNVDSFAHGLNLYKLFWVFLVACVVGWFCEMGYCFIKHGYVESRQGMLYGPFSQVYGFGAVIMVLLLYRFRHSRDMWIFGISMVIGGAFEWVCSYLQEMAFGTVSWDYSNATGSIGGRTSLIYMFFWGIMGCVFIKLIYPKLSSLIENIPNRIGKPLTWVFCVFLLVNATLSASAVYRQSLRHQDIPPSNAYEQFLDEKYHDDFLKQIYPNMVKVEG